MKNFFFRTYQFVFRILACFLNWRKPRLLSGKGSLAELPEVLKKEGVKSVLIITDKGIVKLGLLETLETGLKNSGIAYHVYDGTVPNPTVDNVEEAARMFLEKGCEALIGFGGGTAIDCAKGVGARIARPKKTLNKMKGVLKVGRRIPLLVAVPTTAGTGSEGTLAAVITDPRTHDKYAINDVNLIPHIAVHDPLLTAGLPPHLTATTGMDALTHAVEAYIGRSNTRETKKLALDAVRLIFDNLEKAYKDGNDLEARLNMLKASYYAGLAFTRAYVGNVHAIAHTFGGFYNIPHGFANAVILPVVLKAYGKKAQKKLAELADLVGLSEAGETTEKKAERFIETIEKMNERMGIPKKIQVPDLDNLDLMIERAYHEANPLYPVPMIFTRDDFRKIYLEVTERGEK
ncbi:MAG TPA: iron-containing alcohol dehydrogenase [Acholeplasmataceae bacterium]|nr:iron-containing alcohol dehydrogenase [Acholeplasmataceae bacterium]